MTGKRVSLDDLFAQREAEMRAFYESPEGKAQEARVEAKMKLEREAQEAYEAANPRTAYDDGQDAFLRGAKREPPEDLSDEDRRQWLDGYDAEAEAHDGGEFQANGGGGGVWHPRRHGARWGR